VETEVPTAPRPFAARLPGGPPLALPGEKPRLVYVDDAPSARARIEATLGETYAVQAYACADDALRDLRVRRPAAIVADLDLPGDRGAQFVKDVKGDAALRRVPLIVLAGDDRDASRSLELGADDFLAKPYGVEQLRARIAVAIRWARAYDTLQSQHAELVRVHGLLAAGEARTRAILDTAQEAILLLGLDGLVRDVNPAATRTFGWTAAGAVGRSFSEELVAPRSREALRADLLDASLGRSCVVRPALGVRMSGAEFPMECRITRIETQGRSELCAFVRDVSEAKRLEFELHQSQKLEAVGRLAAGIAHEINTPIQFIGDNTRFLQDAFQSTNAMLGHDARALAEAGLPEATRAALERAREELDLPYVLEQVPRAIARTLDGVQRVATIVRAMKEFAHPDQKEMASTDLNRALQATLDVARNEYKYVADVETSFSPLPLVTCHAGDLNQVFLNLIVNAAHAIADVVRGTSRRGVIRVATRLDGAAVEVAVTDSGWGIPEEIRDKIFEPFFTTKEIGRGTGQGLAIARSIVEKHRGAIRFETAVGEGTTFFVVLPVDPSPARSAA
jgi:PAS domain S-box-containing protein